MAPSTSSHLSDRQAFHIDKSLRSSSRITTCHHPPRDKSIHPKTTPTTTTLGLELPREETINHQPPFKFKCSSFGLRQQFRRHLSSSWGFNCRLFPYLFVYAEWIIVGEWELCWNPTPISNPRRLSREAQSYYDITFRDTIPRPRQTPLSTSMSHVPPGGLVWNRTWLMAYRHGKLCTWTLSPSPQIGKRNVFILPPMS